MSGEHARNERKRWEEEVADLRAEVALQKRLAANTADVLHAELAESKLETDGMLSDLNASLLTTRTLRTQRDDSNELLGSRLDVIEALRAELATLHTAATDLYEAGLWRIHETPIGTREEDRLWEVMRAALGRNRL